MKIARAFYYDVGYGTQITWSVKITQCLLVVHYRDMHGAGGKIIVVVDYKNSYMLTKLLILYLSAKFDFESTMNLKSFGVISSWTPKSLIDRLIILGRSQELRGTISTLESTGTC